MYVSLADFNPTSHPSHPPRRFAHCCLLEMSLAQNLITSRKRIVCIQMFAARRQRKMSNSSFTDIPVRSDQLGGAQSRSHYHDASEKEALLFSFFFPIFSFAVTCKPLPPALPSKLLSPIKVPFSDFTVHPKKTLWGGTLTHARMHTHIELFYFFCQFPWQAS